MKLLSPKEKMSLSVLHLDSPHIRDPLGLPFSRGDYSFDPQFKLVASCNGILCVCVCNGPRDIKNPQTYLWNPATKQSKLIPLHNLRDEIFLVAIQDICSISLLSLVTAAAKAVGR
ncbi:hypothetical protein POM88_011900 [Heracleum sosnowskyi]|uniref:Uncharacterized protein n=1 Tax=Heracleum sosnowskyi TaxID=360622 RepID=A0AAD8IVE2_9APIA|nr:hypothetical protein POM88_011900 [Heracleum sosnowskyi]